MHRKKEIMLELSILTKRGPHLYERNPMGWLSDLTGPLRPCFQNLLMEIRRIGISTFLSL